MDPIHRPVGTPVILSRKSFGVLLDGHKSIKAHPSSHFVARMEKYIGQSAVVTDDFSPGYERTIRFADGQHFHVKDNWVESV